MVGLCLSREPVQVQFYLRERSTLRKRNRRLVRFSEVWIGDKGEENKPGLLSCFSGFRKLCWRPCSPRAEGSHSVCLLSSFRGWEVGPRSLSSRWEHRGSRLLVGSLLWTKTTPRDSSLHRVEQYFCGPETTLDWAPGYLGPWPGSARLTGRLIPLSGDPVSLTILARGGGERTVIAAGICAYSL